MMASRSTPRGRPPQRRTSFNERAASSSRRGDGLGGEQVEGRQAVLELLRAKRRSVRKILMADAQDPSSILDDIEREAQRARVSVQIISAARLDREARTEGHQGVVAFAERIPSVPLHEIVENDQVFLVVCDGVTDPRNLGAILRSADGAGVSAVVLPRHRSARITPAVTKTAAGAVEYTTFCEVGGIAAAIDQLNKAGVMTVGLASEAKASLYDLDLAQTRVALVIGGEQSGLSQLVRKRCATMVSIPQLGSIASLNAGVAASIAAFEIARQRAQAEGSASL